jgi:acyl carrier protein
MSADIERRVIETIAKSRGLPSERVTPGATFEELGMTSLDALALIYDLEEEFDISIPNEEAMGLRNVRQAVESVRRLLAGGLAPGGEAAGGGQP